MSTNWQMLSNLPLAKQNTTPILLFEAQTQSILLINQMLHKYCFSTDSWYKISNVTTPVAFTDYEDILYQKAFNPQTNTIYMISKKGLFGKLKIEGGKWDINDQLPDIQ